MRTRTRSIALFFIASFSCLLFSQDMPRFRWENFTTANGLPNDHVYSVLVDGTASGPAQTMASASSRVANGRYSVRVMAWRTGSAVASRSTSEPATYGLPHSAA